MTHLLSLLCRRGRWVVALALLATSSAWAETGTLVLTLRDAQTGEPTPARLHVRGADGQFHIASDALMFGGDCDMTDAGAGYTNLAAALDGFTDRLRNVYTATTQFYSEGLSTIEVPAGTVEIGVYKGPEYRVASASIEVPENGRVEHTVALERWSDLPASGWYSADDHLHIQRPHPDLNDRILKMMQAEDIHVANLLQMGKVRNFKIAPQYAFGEESHYQRGNYILATGQENPRTHFLGHTITLGASQPLFDADRYLVYRLIWEASAELGGINGFAHAYMPNGSALTPYDGLAVVLPHNLLNFLEVLQFNRSGYAAWYDVLNLGFRVSPTAGTDYPCAAQNIPGHERFYTRVEGDLTYAKWIEAVRAGRTFVTTGPMVEFRINGEDIGSEIELSSPGTVRVEGSISFDRTRHFLEVAELIQNGDLAARFSRVEGQDRIEFATEITVDESSWFAIRGYGTEVRSGFAIPFHFGDMNPTSNVHTAPIYVTLANGPAIAESATARRIAREWLARLRDLETVLDPANMDYLGAKLENPTFDAVPRETLIGNREAVLAEIATAKEFFEARANQ